MRGGNTSGLIQVLNGIVLDRVDEFGLASAWRELEGQLCAQQQK